jgi:hypothetical protein
MSAALNARLAKLESAQPQTPQRSIVCMPFNEKWHGHGVEVFAGVFRVEDRYRAGDWQVAYSDRAQLDAWLAQPAQSDAMKVIYKVITAEQVRTTLERLDAEI